MREPNTTGRRGLARAGLPLLLALAGAAMAGGCDGPGAGGGGGGGLPCSVNPNQPFCQADGGAGGQDASGTADTGGSPPDAASPADTASHSDVGVTDTAPPDVTVTPDAGSCFFGERRCSADGVTIEGCVEGHWAPIDACAAPSTCVDGACQGGCVPSCGGAVCGPDGCGGVCGTCSGGATCVEGWCEAPCQPSCGSAQCGPDGCGGVCGTCSGGTTCVDGTCVSDLPGGACTGAGDMAVLEDGAFAQDFNCLGQCMNGADPQCASPCLQETYGLTPACADCSSAMVACGVSACLMNCVTDPQSPACLDCVATNCAPDFEQCAGVPYDVIGSNPATP